VGGDSDCAAEGVTALGDVGIGGAAAEGAIGIGVVFCLPGVPCAHTGDLPIAKTDSNTTAYSDSPRPAVLQILPCCAACLVIA
jgi:hypothetical protein